MEAAAWTVHTDVFDGPLDLLLYLVRRDGIDLARLEVRKIADAYLAFVDQMQQLNLSVAGEWLVMAATLVHLKSLEMLPRAPTVVDEAAEDPREAFARQLREYKRYKEAGQELDRRPQLFRDTFPRPDSERPESPLEAGTDAFGLLDLYRSLLEARDRPPPAVTMASAGPSLKDQCTSLLAALARSGGRGELTSILQALQSRVERVVAFIGVLEMARLGWLEVRQRVHLGEVLLTATVSPEQADWEALTGYVAASETA